MLCASCRYRIEPLWWACYGLAIRSYQQCNEIHVHVWWWILAPLAVVGTHKDLLARQREVQAQPASVSVATRGAGANNVVLRPSPT
jgi:hypothetical protein